MNSFALLIGFKFILFLLLLGFIFFGMDIRKRDNVLSVVKNKAIIIMKLACIVLLIFYLWSVVMITHISWPQLLCLVFTLLGVILIASAKISLGKNFSWTGYKVKNMEVVKHGPYKYMKHPLYYGVYIFELGAVINYISVTIEYDYFILLLIIPTLALIYAVSFNLLMARKETKNINEILSKRIK